MDIACTLVAVVTLKNVYIAVVVIVVVVVQIVVLTCPYSVYGMRRTDLMDHNQGPYDGDNDRTTHHRQQSRTIDNQS